MRRLFVLLAAWAALVNLCSPAAALEAEDAPPNVVLIFVDNFGNGDLGCFGSTLHRTPNIDRLAAKGAEVHQLLRRQRRLHAEPGGLMTGCYPRRVNLHVSGAGSAVLPLDSPKGLNPDETTIAEVLKAAGYATACIRQVAPGRSAGVSADAAGLRHVLRHSLQRRHDEGQAAGHVARTAAAARRAGDRGAGGPQYAGAALDRGGGRVSSSGTASGRSSLYLPQSMPGSTSQPFSSPAFRGKSRNGDLRRRGRRTGLVDRRDHGGAGTAWVRPARRWSIWTSDNGAVRRNPPQGSCAPYRGFGYDTSEGAMRVPCVMRWPGRIPAGTVCDAVARRWTCCPPRKLAGAPLAGAADRRARRPAAVARPGGRPFALGRGRLLLLLHGPVAGGPRRRRGSSICRWEEVRRRSGARVVSAEDGTLRRPPRRRRDPRSLGRTSARGQACCWAMAERAREEIGDVDQPGKRPASCRACGSPGGVDARAAEMISAAMAGLSFDKSLASLGHRFALPPGALLQIVNRKIVSNRRQPGLRTERSRRSANITTAISRKEKH